MAIEDSPKIKKAFPLPFKGKLVGDGLFKLLAPFEYRNPPVLIKVPTDFITDGASIPSFAYSLIGGRWTGKYVRAAIVHDYGYFFQTMTRKEVDDIFLEGMEILGVPLLNRWIMYKCVRMVAWIFWNKVKKEKEVI
ncbi:MAG TPA: DUF1353 domain-containing protein [Candidatus Scalindua sp.]|nr:DUF1353 domain-containing protein [Candidatus Scalindua sp.]